MRKNEDRAVDLAEHVATGAGSNDPPVAVPQPQEVKVNNRALLAQYVEAATLAQERLLAYLSGVLGERGVEGQIRGWDVARGVIIVAGESEPAAGPSR